MPSKNLSLTSTVCRKENCLSAEVDDAMVLMSIDKGNYYSLDTIGADIWQRLGGAITVTDLCATLCKEYDTDIETIHRDVLALLERLLAESLIEICP